MMNRNFHETMAINALGNARYALNVKHDLIGANRTIVCARVHLSSITTGDRLSRRMARLWAAVCKLDREISNRTSFAFKR